MERALEVISAKIAPAERAVIDAVAKLEHESTSATVRRLLVSAARNRLRELAAIETARTSPVIR